MVSGVNVHWFTISATTFPRNVVIVDVSRAAAGMQPVLASLIEGLAEETPEPEQPVIAFLGGTARYPLTEFLRRSDNLFAQNAGRGRVIAPTLEAITKPWPVRVTVFAAQPIFDLEDWLQPPYGSRLGVIPLDSTVPIAGPNRDVALDSLDMAGIARIVNPRPLELRMRVTGGLPVGWSDSAWRCEPGLAVHSGIPAAPPRIGWLLPPDVTVVEACCETAWEGGLTTRHKLETTAAPVSTSDWQTLTGLELTRLDAWRLRRPAACDHCQQDHPPGQVHCANGDTGLLPTLATLSIRDAGFLRVKIKTFQASVLPVPEPRVILSDTAVVGVNAEGLPIRWEFDPARQKWAVGRTLSTFERITPEEYLLTLPQASPVPGGSS